MRSDVTQCNYHQIQSVKQVRTWALSWILRAHTASGDVYFKAAPRLPLFAHEPMLMQGLSALYPDPIPVSLHVNEQRGWMM